MALRSSKIWLEGEEACADGSLRALSPPGRIDDPLKQEGLFSMSPLMNGARSMCLLAAVEMYPLSVYLCLTTIQQNDPC